MTRTNSNFLWAFGATSLITIGLGALTMAQAGLPAGLWLRNPAAWVAGLGMALLIARFPPPRLAILGMAVILLALTFVLPGQSGVHRWIGLGPLQINVAALVLPIVIASLRPDWISAAVGIILAALLYFQPDASQGSAFAMALVITSFAAPKKLWTYLFLLPMGPMVSAWDAKNLLPPVAHVEGIIDMAKAQTPLLAMGIILMLASTALVPLFQIRMPEKRQTAVALTAYFAVSAAAVVTGYFPVPLAGYGVSFVIGWWLGAGMLASNAKAVET